MSKLSQNHPRCVFVTDTAGGWTRYATFSQCNKNHTTGVFVTGTAGDEEDGLIMSPSHKVTKIFHNISSVRRPTAHALGLGASFYTKILFYPSF